MTEGLKRYYGCGHLHFITFSCYRRLPFLQAVRAKDLFIKELSLVRREYEFGLVGYVLMPEHVHLLLSEPAKGTPSTVLQMLKQRVSRKLRKKTGDPHTELISLPAAEIADDYAQFWQKRFYDFNVYSDGKKCEKLDYMHCNPVTRELVRRPQDWPWSSYLLYEKGEVGLIPIDPV
jgi:putative transposase